MADGASQSARLPAFSDAASRVASTANTMGLHLECRIQVSFVGIASIKLCRLCGILRIRMDCDACEGLSRQARKRFVATPRLSMRNDLD
jgi:hypothetical protein